MTEYCCNGFQSMNEESKVLIQNIDSNTKKITWFLHCGIMWIEMIYCNKCGTKLNA